VAQQASRFDLARASAGEGQLLDEFSEITGYTREARAGAARRMEAAVGSTSAAGLGSGLDPIRKVSSGSGRLGFREQAYGPVFRIPPQGLDIAQMLRPEPGPGRCRAARDAVTTVCRMAMIASLRTMALRCYCRGEVRRGNR